MIDASCFGLHQGREEEKQGEDEVTSCHPFSHLRRYDVHHHHRHRLRRKPQVLHPLCTHLFPPLSVITSCLPRPLVCKQALRAPSQPRNLSNMRAHHLVGMRENCDLISREREKKRERERERERERLTRNLNTTGDMSSRNAWPALIQTFLRPAL